MSMSAELEDWIDNIDAAIFTGDTFTDADARKSLRATMARWERELKEFDRLDEEE